MASILLVEDDRMLRLSLRRALESRGHVVVDVGTIAHARPHFDLGTLDVALVDVGLPDGSGLDLLELSRQVSDPPALVIMSGQEDLALTITAIHRGASDCLFKPLDLYELDVVLAHAIEQRAALRKVRLNTATPGDIDAPSLVGRTAAMRAVAKSVAHAASADEPVLVIGESGTGKEVVARTIHRSSARASKPFVAVNCAALSASLVEAELFGSSRGAYTGSVADRPGRLETAGDGTLFLDEIGELALDLQPKLLRVLQERTFERVGDPRTLRFDARIIAATNRDLATEVRAGRFRADLFYRLDVLSVAMPALRDRMADLELLAARLLASIAGPGRAVHHMDAVAVTRLHEHSWPGNVRELGNVLRRAVAMTPRGVITGPVIDVAIASRATVSDGRNAPADTATIEPLIVVEQRHIERTLEACGWNKRAACRLLGISRPTLDRKVREFGLRRPGASETAEPESEIVGDETPLPIAIDDGDGETSALILPKRSGPR